MSTDRASDEALKFQVCALERCIESQRALGREIEKANPGDAFAALMIFEDIEKLCELRETLVAPPVSDVTAQLIARDQTGRKKYGTTLDRQDLSHADWLQHMAEELLDAAGYALAAKAAARRAKSVQAQPNGITGQVVEIGDDEAGQPRIVIHTTADEIRAHAGNILFKRVTVTAAPEPK